MTTTSILDYGKAEADTALPALEINRKPQPVFKKPIVKVGPNSIVFIGEQGTDPGSTIIHHIDPFMPETTSNTWIMDSIGPAFIANENVGGRSLLKYRVMMDTNETITVSPKSNVEFENTKRLLQSLSNAYSAGTIDIPEIVRALGEPWTESMVILLLEIMKAHRPLSVGELSNQEEMVLQRLAEIRGTPEVDKFNGSEWIKREVIASQRIESIYVMLDNFPKTS